MVANVIEMQGGQTRSGSRLALGSLLTLLCMATTGCLTVHREAGCLGGDCLGMTPHVEVLRGISGYWPGVDRFQEKLAARGISSTVSFCELYPQVADRLVEQQRVNPATPIVVVGYSLGANNALRLARRLQDEGVTIDSLVLLETTYQDTVPGNVRCCFNAYKPRPLDEIPFMRGIPLAADCQTTRLTNYDLRAHDDGRYRGENHLTLCSDDDVQCLLAGVVARSFQVESSNVGYARISDHLLAP